MSYFENIRIEKIQKSELKDTAKLLTDAFETNPAYSLIFGKTQKLRKGLFWLFKTNLFLLNQKQVLTNVVKEKDSGKIIGTFTLIPPKGVKSNVFNYFQIGLPTFIMKFGFRTLFKMMKMDVYNKEILNKAIQANQYYYLSMVVIKEKYRGTGIGSFMIKNCLDELSTSDDNCRLVGLTTQLPENVIFYSRLGFELLDEGVITFEGDSYYNYNMQLKF